MYFLGYQQTLSRRGGPSPQSMLSGIENSTGGDRGPPHPNDDAGSCSSYHPSGACSSTQSYQSSFQPFYPFSPSNLQIGQPVGPIGPPPVQFGHHLAPGHGRELHHQPVYYPGYNQQRAVRRPVSVSVAQTIIPITNPGYPQPLFFLASTDLVNQPQNDNQFFNQ